MIYFDVTKMGRAKHRSGLMRVSARLREELGAETVSVRWENGGWRDEAGNPVNLAASDWVLTTELFCEAERPGFWEFLRGRKCRLAATFNDAIPLKHPHITWPQSVARHPEYLKMLAAFDRVFAISQASREELLEFWRWQGVEQRGQVETVVLGADFATIPRVRGEARSGDADTRRASLLSVGILEPRKNQAFLMDVCAGLWAEGLEFELHLVGRVNPHFGRAVKAKAAGLRRSGARIFHHEGVGDEEVRRLYAAARASVFPTIAEGCGLPVLESLWQGVPCVCSDLPVLRENADGGGCAVAALNDAAAWTRVLRRVLTDDAWLATLRAEAEARVLPTWRQTAAGLRLAFRE